ncbi:NADH:ubiquinone reductase (Na(+)-transporting) subunit F [Granulicoccus phenolivorans]|uniref:NADH:ubiquinone reductase (Na(+)-transporting) subunit F n=1 Tax=Granulicoccus phenolivorans TaxID=266854 RepID=UPI00040ADFEF|nr:phenol 2-monooxygenase domain-containing protein [Granulicoccus phenolivorans]
MSYELTIEPLGQTIDLEEEQTILDAALRAGIYLPHACVHGLCGTCKIQVLDGEVDHGEASTFALMDFEREEQKTLACCATAESDLVVEAEIEEDPDARNLPIQDYAAEVTRIEDLTPTIRGIWLKPDRPVDYQAGQYINLTVSAEIGSRAFSLATPPSSGELELNVRRVPGGEGTAYLHEQLAVGDRVHFSGPYGRFFVKKSAHVPVLFFAGGSGLASPKAMLLDLLEDGFDLPIILVYGQRTRAELYYHEEFLELAQRYPNLRYVPALSDEPEDSEWDGFRGYVHEAAQAALANDFRGHKAYLCGPPLMIDASISALMQGRLFEKDIYTEKFISAADAQQVRSPPFRSL